MLEIPKYTGQIPVADTAVIIVDMQAGFMSSDYSLGKAGMDVRPLAQAVPGCVRLVQSAREAGVPVIFTRFVYAPDMSDFPRHRRDRSARRIELLSLAEGQPEIEIISELAPRAGELVIDKSRPSSFYGTRLEPILTARGIRNLVVAGVTTSICVETTVRDAGQRDYHTFVVSDAVAEIEPNRHHYSLFNMAWSFAEIVTSDQVRAAWQGQAAVG
ncbi:cysteine hydrolase [Phaeovulum sp. NW3]|uniref:cysteine hydrolase n=1 Tax=Phaeovulum sp. NW3 TaxID=2934933 RepID=UPI00201FD95E|nr:cysteine hydrolase [Phaeovulum sp. NW3]MCL7466269.1 cysteine hydrolase [Phaeovulum sp. NW3]